MTYFYGHYFQEGEILHPYLYSYKKEGFLSYFWAKIELYYEILEE